MNLVKVSDLFDVSYGHSLELNRLQKNADGVNFVSRTANNNGVSARVAPIPDIEPMAAGKLTVALGGSVLETFVQPEPFYTGFHIFCLSPLTPMTLEQKLYYCMCLRANKYRYNYGRQANRTLRDIMVPALNEVPEWVAAALPSVVSEWKQKLDIV
ncbi:hypothetical protein HAP99_03900 [Acidithiobacillus caldus]|uniref:restriction endonuclease subunit S n=1 Tax=Acidithiobacillus caldus TaxID=33059 RepID=UPI001C07AEDF|nr:restriction endonuclease subunit S [Acidithiobacillus caldus]MBU2782323.1 hypothetical protein [Acidithiobacillus caldus]